MQVSMRDIALMIDHSLLNPTLPAAVVAEGCDLARRYAVASVCVKPCHVSLAAEHLSGSPVAVGTVIGFPHGGHLTGVKVYEAERATAQGATELDMVINIGALLGGDTELVQTDVAAVVAAARRQGARVKVILENAYLSNEQKVLGCQLAEAAGADWVKTSTGYAPTGATPEDLRLMRATVSERVQVKAAGGVRTLAGALAVRALGCTRFGATRTAEILEDARRLEPLTLPNPATITEL